MPADPGGQQETLLEEALLEEALLEDLPTDFLRLASRG
jgi:hypothetical protein